MKWAMRAKWVGLVMCVSLAAAAMPARADETRAADCIRTHYDDAAFARAVDRYRVLVKAESVSDSEDHENLVLKALGEDVSLLKAAVAGCYKEFSWTPEKGQVAVRYFVGQLGDRALGSLLDQGGVPAAVVRSAYASLSEPDRQALWSGNVSAVAKERCMALLRQAHQPVPRGTDYILGAFMGLQSQLEFGAAAVAAN